MARLTHALLLASSLASGAAAQNQTQGEGLHSLMVAAGKLYFGTATETNNFNDAAYQAISTNKNEFGMFTPENSQKWEVTEPKQGQFVFTNADQVAAKAKSNGQLLRCHTLVWHSQLPSFVSSGTFTPTTLTAIITAHITNVMTHYSGQCYAWDVVNEALNDDGTFRQSVFFKTLGSDYIPLSFRVAASVDPSAKLYYNDFNLETAPAKADAAVKIVQLVQKAGVKIDGVGFQAHLNVGQTPSRSSLAATLNRFTALGVEVAYTELDIAHTSLPASDADRAQQAKDYVAAVGSCLDVKGCVGVTVWQFTDKFSWVPSTFPGKGDACLFTKDYQRKPAYEAVVELLKGAASAAASGSGSGSGSGSTTSNSTARPSAEVAAGGSTAAAVNEASVVVGGMAGLVWSAVAVIVLVFS